MNEFEFITPNDEDVCELCEAFLDDFEEDPEEKISPYGEHLYCMEQCEFYSKCRMGMRHCVKLFFERALKYIYPKESDVIRMTYGVDGKELQNDESIAEKLGLSEESLIKMRNEALEDLRCGMLRSTDMCLTLFENEDSNYLRLWRDIFKRSEPREQIYLELLDEQISNTEEQVAVLQSKAERIKWKKKKITSQMYITRDSTITECCFGDPYGYEKSVFESNTTIAELQAMTGKNVFKKCEYKKYWFEELVTVLFEHKFYFADYSEEISTQEYIQKIYSEVPSKIRAEIVGKNIDILELTVRAYNCLKRADIVTVQDLILCTEKDILGIRNMSPRIFEEIKRVLAKVDLCLLGSEMKSAENL